MTEHADNTVPRESTRILGSPNRFKLATFGPNASGGSSMTSADGTIAVDWKESRNVALATERAGIEALIPVGRWRGFEGDTNFNGRSFETFTWAAALGAITEQIQIFSTFHMPTAHPVRVAKEIATIDHVTGGRFGINFVAGWNAAEINLFGLTQREHDDRYEFADEFVDLLKRLLEEDEEFDYKGKFFEVPRAVSDPKPVQTPLPVVMSAGISPRGRDFAAKHSDINFILVDNLETAKAMVADTKRNALEKYGRDIRVFGCGHIVCADTEKEAKEFFEYYVDEKGDWPGVSNLLEALIPNQDVGKYEREGLARNLVAGWGALPLVGTPEQVAQGMADMAASGMDGITLSWVNYEEGLEQFRTEILPLLIEEGLREDERIPERSPAEVAVE
jgi:alkanesulfonate monooxygenase SsuD/methylene tetrahydromethanopterin reductase-like flavin-dependent oxidoreductase (luciferase family)